LGIDKTRLTVQMGHAFRRDVFLPAFELRADVAHTYFDKIRGSKSRFLLGYPSAIYRLAMLAQEMNQQIEFQAVFPTAELILPEWEETIRKVFGCAVLPYYGCGEVNSLGYHASGVDAYLIPEEHACIEVLQRDGSATVVGEGRFLITDLDNYAMPIMRYANGDAGSVTGPAGSFPFRRIDRLDGRYNSFLLTDTGELISGVIGTHIFRHLASVRSYRIIQEEPLQLRIKVVATDEFAEEHERLIAGLFARHLGSKMNVRIEKVPELAIPSSGKSIFVINHCLKDSIAYPDNPAPHNN
jgi:phenylacetate-CoA ligase